MKHTLLISLVHLYHETTLKVQPDSARVNTAVKSYYLTFVQYFIIYTLYCTYSNLSYSNWKEIPSQSCRGRPILNFPQIYTCYHSSVN